MACCPSSRPASATPRRDYNQAWKQGDDSTVNYPPSQRISSFAVLDFFVQTVVNTFSSTLRLVVIAGHSAGGQVAVRYAFTSPVQPKVRCLLAFQS